MATKKSNKKKGAVRAKPVAKGKSPRVSGVGRSAARTPANQLTTQKNYITRIGAKAKRIADVATKKGDKVTAKKATTLFSKLAAAVSGL